MLVGTVSHELKTPLTGLRMAVYLLLEKTLGPLEPAQREMLESARDDADRLMRILDSLLDLARLEAGASSLERASRVRWWRRFCGRSLTRPVRFVVARGDHRLEVRQEAGLGEVNVDATRLRHVFINLLSNASKYSDAGGVITLSAAPEPLGFVRFAVHDTSGAIPRPGGNRAPLRTASTGSPVQSKQGAGIGPLRSHARSSSPTEEASPAQAPPQAGTEFQFLIPID